MAYDDLMRIYQIDAKGHFLPLANLFGTEKT